MDRDAFLQRVRQAIAEGNRPGATPALPERRDLGYQGAGSDSVHCFCEALSAAGGFAHLVRDCRAAADTVLDIVSRHLPKKILLGRGQVLDALDLGPQLRERDWEVIDADRVDPANWRDSCFAADIGISGVHYLIAETGTMVVAGGPDGSRSASLLPPVHIAVADRRQLLADLFDLIHGPGIGEGAAPLPSSLTLITGPSKTGDIELKLVTGVHGPGEVHVVLIAS